MENNSKRFLSLLLALVMVIGMMPMGHVHAEEEGETVRVLQKVTSVEDGEQYVIAFAGTTRAVANLTRSWGNGKGNGLDTGSISLGAVPTELYLWTLEEAEGGFKIRGVQSGTYVSISANNAVLGEDGQVFTFTMMDGAMVIRVKDGDQRFNNLGDENCVGGWASDGTKFDIYKVAEVAEVADPYGKLRGQWRTYYVDTQHPNVGNEGLFSMAFDNNPSTHWHSKYQGGEDKLNGSNTFTGIIDLGATYTLNWFSYIPRQDGTNSGQVTQASLYVSAVENPNKDNAGDWTLAAEHVSFADDASEKVINFTTQSVRYVKFVAEASDDGWVAASEFHVGYNAPAECEHSYTEEIIKEATCIDGQKKLTCDLCGHSYIETIPATEEHTEKSVPAVAPSLDNTGLTEGTVCSVCGHVITEQEVIPATYNDGIVPKEYVTLTAGTWEQNGGANEGSADLAWDDNFGTMWHTDWSGTTADKLWIQFNLSETYNATALRYKPRANAANGTITKYEIQVSHDGENFFTVKTGTWEATDSWKVAEFDAHNAMSVRLVVVEFVTDQPSKKLASAAEIRLVGTPVDHEHTFTTETVPATCTDDGFTTISCKCGDTHTTVIPATGEHTSGVAAKENVTASGYDLVVRCTVCNTVLSTEHVNTIYKSSMTMANSLNMNFCFAKDMVEDWTGYYVVITKENDETQTLYFNNEGEWATTDLGVEDGPEYWYVTYTGIAAKEMTDVLTVTIYDAKGNPVSEPFIDSVRDHAIRNLQTTDNDRNKTMIMDMLNYGAAAQQNAGYKTGNLANAGEELDDYRQYATESVEYTNQMNNTNRNIRYLANVKMVDNIQFMMAFYGIDESMTLKISFKHWNSKEDEVIEKVIPVTELTKSGSYYVVTLQETVIADGFQTITCEIVDADNVVATITDSMASYAARAKSNTNSELYEAIMKFSASAKTYLEAKNNP